MRKASSSAQKCPICGARQPLESPRCNRCGAALRGVPEPGTADQHTRSRRATTRPARLEGPLVADWDQGESDLHEGLLPGMPFRSIGLSLLVLTILSLTGLLVLPRLAVPDPAPDVLAMESTQTPNSTALTRRALPPTNTRIAVIPTLALATVTPMPPTLTLTPTRGPCIQKARQGDTLYGLASRCGHKDLAIVEVILRLNNMSSAAELQINQEVEIPWPTEIGAPPQAPSGGEPDAEPMLGAEPTLPPGVMWHTVRKGETALSIVFDHGITMRILRDLNPEVMFDGCDFGEIGGGPACNVMLYEGQRLRVPAPTPTPTLSLTPSGSETPTPSPTATFNAPFAQAPSDNMLFESFEFPTLRWTSSGQLGADEIYLVTIEDRTAGILYYVPTRELSFQMKPEWQPTDGKRHIFAWKVAVATLQDGETAIPSPYATETRTFTWQSR